MTHEVFLQCAYSFYHHLDFMFLLSFIYLSSCENTLSFFFVKINLNCVHAVHILWSCKLSVVVRLPADSHAKNACTHGTAKCFVSITWLTLIEYAAISSLADHVK